MKRNAQELKQEVERARVVAEEAYKKLELVLVEAKDAKAAEQRPVKEINILFEVGRVLNSKFSGTINMSNENFEAMRAKAKECEDLRQPDSETANPRRRRVNLQRKKEKCSERLAAAASIFLRSSSLSEKSRNEGQKSQKRQRKRENPVIWAPGAGIGRLALVFSDFGAHGWIWAPGARVLTYFHVAFDYPGPKGEEDDTHSAM
ncbi:hypothetical protein Fmac_005670 [Flemingia macrophylla]|uniref:Uncharacterized protein n=1 Tax=Flemingia macrophylla TaxID=520843 RepID=A0ABD1N8E4_9FABA